MDTVLLENIFLMLAGVGLGYIAGLIPGIGTLVMLLMVYPFILDATMFQMILFYLALISSAQFSGSVMATIFGIPGDSSSLPAVTEGHRMFKDGRANIAISNAALGSVLGSIVAVAIAYILMPASVYLISNFYNNTAQLIILIFTCVSMLFLIGNGVLINCGLFAFGFLLATVGLNAVPWFVFADQVIPYDIFPKLINGLPLFPVMLALYVFPVLLNTSKQFQLQNLQQDYKDQTRTLTHLKHFVSNISSSLRGTLIGTIAGLIPHVGTQVASNWSYIIEKKLGIKRQTYNHKGDLKSLVSAETANNSAAFMSLMPLILIGIPITTSEALLLSLLDRNADVINYSTFVNSGMFQTLIFWFIVINILCLILSWPAVKYINHLKKININTLMIITVPAMIASTYYAGSQSLDQWYYLAVLAALIPLGFFLRKVDTMILVIAFVLQDKILATGTAFFQIYFL